MAENHASHLSVPTWAVVAASVGGYAYMQSGKPADVPVPVPFIQDVSEATSQAALTLFPAMAQNCDDVANLIDSGKITKADEAVKKLSEMNKAARMAALRPPQDALEQADGELSIISRTLKSAGEGYRKAAGTQKKTAR